MSADVVYISSIVVAIMFVAIAVFQVLLSLGFPIGNLQWVDIIRFYQKDYVL